MNNKCPKCGKKLSPFYMKATCPNCGVNMLYYNMSDRLEQDAENAKREVVAIWNFVRKIDKAHLVEKYCAKKQKPLPWEQGEDE